MNKIPIIELEGSPYECGKQYGKAIKKLIKKNIELYTRCFAYYVNLNKNQAISIACKFIPIIEEYDYNIKDELQGIANGADVSLEEIVMLNARSSILSNTISLQECTAFAVLPSATNDNKIWIGQNWDWIDACNNLFVLLKIKQTNKPALLTLTEAGHLAKIGFNEMGIGLCINWLFTNYALIGLPVHLISRAILNSESLTDAIDVLCKNIRATSANYLIVHKDGFAIDIETTSDDIDFIEPEDDILVHTNHFISSHLGKINKYALKMGSSLVRFQQANNILRTNNGNINQNLLIKLQKDHTFYPSSICRHPNEKAFELDRTRTLASVIMDIKSSIMYISAGNPCENDYMKVSL